MRCDVATCWNKGRVNINVLIPEADKRADSSARVIVPQEDGSFDFAEVHILGLCYGCYLRLVRTRRRSGSLSPWPDKPMTVSEYRAAFDSWEPEPECPNDEYMAEMEKTVWRNR